MLGKGVFSSNTPCTLLCGKLYCCRTFAANDDGDAWAEYLFGQDT